MTTQDLTDWKMRTDSARHTVVCHTGGTGNLCGYDYAAVDLTPAYARTLLGYRPLIAAPHARGEFYALEFFAGAAAFGTADADGLDPGEFAGAPPGFALATSRTDTGMLRVMSDGVMWTGRPRHGEGPEEFETETVAWGELEAVAAGGWPFDTFEPADAPAEAAGEEFDCAECGRPARENPDGATNHLSEAEPSGVDHDADEDHVPFRESP